MARGGAIKKCFWEHENFICMHFWSFNYYFCVKAQTLFNFRRLRNFHTNFLNFYSKEKNHENFSWGGVVFFLEVGPKLPRFLDLKKELWSKTSQKIVFFYFLKVKHFSYLLKQISSIGTVCLVQQTLVP